VNSEIFDSLEIGNKKLFLLKSNEDNTSFCTYNRNGSNPVSGKLPANETFGTGQSTIHFEKNIDTAFIDYEWNSGLSGGFYRTNIGLDDNGISLKNIVGSFDNENTNYTEEIDFTKRKYNRKCGNFSQSGTLQIAAEEGTSNLPFVDFIPAYGKQNIKNKEDLSASVTINYSESILHFSIEVTDDYIVTGNTINSDHIELWWSDAAFNGSLVTKPGEKTWQLLVYFDGNNAFCSAGYPENVKNLIADRINYLKTDKGYKFDFTIASNLLNHENQFKSNGNNDDGDILLMTIVISDSDMTKKQEAMIASSQLKWGNPATFGRVGLVKNGKKPIVSWNSFF